MAQELYPYLRAWRNIHFQHQVAPRAAENQQRHVYRANRRATRAEQRGPKCTAAINTRCRIRCCSKDLHRPRRIQGVKAMYTKRFRAFLPSALLSAAALLCVVLGPAGSASAQTVPAPVLQHARTASFTYDETTGLLTEQRTSPGTANYCVSTSYEYDEYGNRTRTNTANCPGASGTALFSARSATA